MPDREKSDSPRVPAGRDRQLSSLARLAIVVGIPFATAFLRVPLWLTVLLLFGLAGLLFVAPHLSQKSPPDPKQAWMRLTASFVSLQSAYRDVQESPANEAALKQFSTFEERCLSLLASRADSGWGADTQYATKIGNEIAAMSAEVRALSAKPEVPEMVGLILESEGVAAHHDANTSPSAEPDAPTPAKTRGLATASAVTALQPRSPELSAKPDVSIPAEKQSLRQLSEGAAVQPGGLAPSIRPEVLTSEGLLDLIFANQGTARSGGPMSTARPGAPTPAEEQDLTLAGVGAAVQPVSNHRASAESEVPTSAEELVLVGASRDAAVQPERPAAASRIEDRALALGHVLTTAAASPALRSESSALVARAEAATREVKQVLALASAGVAVQPDTSPLPSAKADVSTPAKEQGSVRASEGAALQYDSPALLLRPKVPSLEERLGLIHASEGTAVQPGGPATSSKPEVPAPAERLGLMLAGTIEAVQSGSPMSEARPDVPTPAVQQGLPLASVAAPVPVETSPVLSAKPEVTTLAEKQDLAPASEDAAVRPDSPAAPAKLEAVRLAGKRLTPYVWLPGGVEAAAAFYVSIFRNSLVAGMNRYPEGAYAPAGSARSATVCLDGQELILLNGGPVYKLPEAFSLLVRCVDQAEVDYYWQRLLSGGGEESMCGWLKDRFGVSWQVIPDALLELINDPDPQRAARATEAILKMRKIDIATLREAVGQPEAIALLPHTATPALLT